MNNLEYSFLYDIVNERDGMLVSQLFRYIPEDQRPAYSTFLRNLYKIKGLRFKQVLSQSRAKFVTTSHTITESRMRLMIMVAEGELQKGVRASGYKGPTRLHQFYDDVYERASLATNFTVSDNNHQSRRDSSFYIKIKESSDYVKCSIRRREHNILRKTTKRLEYSTELKAPLQSTGSLYCNHTFIEIRSWNKATPVQIIFHVFDLENDMNKRKWNSTLVKIHQFMLWHELCIRFNVILYTGNETHLKIYKRNFREIQASQFEKIAIYHVSDVKDLAKKCTIEFHSLNTSSYFNTDCQT